LPVLSPENYISYQKALGIAPAEKPRTSRPGRSPNIFADEFGWEEMARKTGEIYNALPPEERTKPHLREKFMARLARSISWEENTAAEIDQQSPKSY